MHNLTTYSLHAELLEDELSGRVDAVTTEIKAWLKKKGANDPDGDQGSFVSLTGNGSGSFRRKLIKSAIGNIVEFELAETAHAGQLFTTTIQTAYSNSRVTVFATLSVTSLSNVVAPVHIYPRCPQVIRTLIEKFNDWRFGDAPVPRGKAIDATKQASAIELCNQITDLNRNLPILVVSTDADEMVWAGIQNELAYDLVGIANVAYVSENTSWTLTDELGKEDSCYLGAIRLYWPAVRSEDGDVELRGTVWTASRLLDEFGSDDKAKKRFLSTIRDTIMSTAVLTMAPPKITRDVHNAAAKERLYHLTQEVREKELDAIIEENSNLSSQLEAANSTIASQKYKIEYLQGELNKRIEPPTVSGQANLPTLPKKGDIRYYKKIGNNGGGIDTLVQTKACNHNAWRPAFNGDQAEKGISKLEGGRSDWKSIQHCGTCTGGGRWRVSW